MDKTEANNYKLDNYDSYHPATSTNFVFQKQMSAFVFDFLVHKNFSTMVTHIEDFPRWRFQKSFQFTDNQYCVFFNEVTEKV